MNHPLVRAALAAAVLSALPAPARLLAWSPKQAPLMTRWARDVDPDKPLPEYPRPQMVRADWLNLNGVWEFKRGAEGDPLPASDAKLPEEILVPFPMESALSGVMDHSERVWYRRHFTVPGAWKDKHVLLHFGAVDYESEVFVNGQRAGVHKGGYLPFTYDVTPLLKGDGPQELVVRVYDPTDNAGEPRGKQSLHPGGIMYTPTTGIWQTVWLEPIPDHAIDSLKIVPDVDGGALKLTVNVSSPAEETAGIETRVVIKDGATEVTAITTSTKPGQATDGLTLSQEDGQAGTKNTFSIDVPHPATVETGKAVVHAGTMQIPVPHAKLWTPDAPFLYDLEVSVIKGGKVVDEVKSYFGMRKISVGDDHGVKKMLLNGKFVFEMGPLDQGFWPDGIYTAPTEAALKNDLEMMKAYRFNMVRKHLKVEPARWYYWCDKLGLLVWQDMPSADSYMNKEPRPPVDTEAFKTQLREMVTAFGNAPSIIMWELFNEGQGQAAFDTPALVDEVRKLDPSRLVNEASGGTWTGHGDVYDAHPYPAPRCPAPHPAQAIVLGEYGGITYQVNGHTWAPEGHGYITAPDVDTVVEWYRQYGAALHKFRDEQGLSAAVYTQITDVETEINGLLTYDRVPKFDPARIVAANHLAPHVSAYKPLVPTSETTAQIWKYTTNPPDAAWIKADFNDDAWGNGRAPFGKQEATVGNTPWTTSDIWLRKHFNPGTLSESDFNHLTLRVYHDDDVQVFINGVPAFSKTGWTTDYEYQPLSAAARKALVPGADNVLAVHCLQKTGGQYIDAGIFELQPSK